MFGEKHWAEPLAWNAKAEKLGVRKRVFCGSMCDVMEDRRDLDGVRLQLYELIEKTPYLDWQLLTKRPQNFRRFLPASWIASPRSNVWLMTTVGVEKSLWRIDELKSCPAEIYGVSVEPLIEALPTIGEHLDGIGWCIVGGESGPGVRPCNVEWIRSVLGQCRDHDVACFVKQLGAHVIQGGERRIKADKKGGDMDEWPHDIRVREMPEVRTR
jgi:protein gp37